MFQNSSSSFVFQRRSVLKLISSVAAISHTQSNLHAAVGSSKFHQQPQPAPCFLPRDGHCDIGDVQIRVVVFIDYSVTEVLRNRPLLTSPGLSYVRFGQRETEATVCGEQVTSLSDQLLVGAHMVVLLLDDTDEIQVQQAAWVGSMARKQGLLTVGVAMRFNTSNAADNARNGLHNSVHSFVRLDTGGVHVTNRALVFLHGLTAGLATLCNVQGYVGFDYEDVHCILQRRGHLAFGVGSASGLDRAWDAAHAALSDIRLTERAKNTVQGVLVIVSAPRNALQLSESKQAMNTVRSAFNKDAHCVYGVMHPDQWGEPTSKCLQVLVIAKISNTVDGLRTPSPRL